MKRFIVFATFVALAISLSPNASATLAVAIPFESKVERADQIVLARCVARESKFDASGRWIVTYATFQIEKSLKGLPAGEITIVVPGGTVGSLHQKTIGIPEFGEGDVNVLFIRNASIGSTVLYFDQGAYRVVDDNGSRAVAPMDSDLTVLDPATGAQHTLRDEPQMSLEDFEARVRDVLSRDGRRMTR